METLHAVDAVDGQVDVGGLRLHYRQLGDPAGPGVLVLHGIMGLSREWDTLTRALAGEHRVVALDLRGHGRSDWAETYTASAMADDVAAAIESLGLAPSHLVGHSMGGMVALLVAARRPDLVDRLALIDIGPESLVGEFADGLADWLAMLGESSYTRHDEASRLWLDGNPLARPELIDHYVEHNLIAGPDGRWMWRFDATGLVGFATAGVTTHELWEAVDGITRPTLLIRGESSPVFSHEHARRMMRRLGDASLVEIPAGAHDLGVEQPEAVTRAIETFLAIGRAHN